MKKLNRSKLVLVGLLALLTAGLAADVRCAETAGLSAGQIIVNATEARVRSAPNLTARVLGATRIGTVYPVLGQKSGWYNINFNGNRGGWISGTIAEPFDDARRAAIYQSIAAKYFKRPTLDFDTASELFEFLADIQTEVAGSKSEPMLAYYHVLALAKTLEALPFNKLDQSPYKDFTAKYEDQIAYSDPAGEYAVRTDTWWDLQRKYAPDPIADEMAWQGANTIIPGECEGYVVCHLFGLRETDAKYLELYQNGKHSAEALQNMKDYLEPIADGASENTNNPGYYITADPDDRVQLEKYVGELRQIVSKIPGTAKTAILALLDQIETGYLPPDEDSPAADEAGLDQFWTDFRAAVIKKDKAAVADLTQFPLGMPYGNKEIKTRAEFLKDYDRIMNLMTDVAKCFEKADLSKEYGRYGVYCGFKGALDDEDNKPNYYYFAKTEAGWRFTGIDNINE